MKSPITISVVLACLVAPILAAPTDEADRVAILKNVAQVDIEGQPGGVTAFGPNAFALVAGKDGKNAQLPIAAAARWQKGRIVVFGHDGFLKVDKKSANGALLPNVAQWAAGNASKPKIGILKNEPLMEHLKAAGFDVVALDDSWATKLSRLDVIFLSPFWITKDDIAPLEKFVQSGGGLVAGGTGWGWVQIFSKDNAQLASEYPGNILLQKAGLSLTAGIPDRTTPEAFAIGGDLTLLNATTALEALTSGSTGKTKLDSAALTQCAATVADAIRSIAPDDKILLPKISALASKESPIPTETKPVRSTDALGRLMLTRDLELLRSAKPDQIRPHPLPKLFPAQSRNPPHESAALWTSTPPSHSGTAPDSTQHREKSSASPFPQQQRTMAFPFALVVTRIPCGIWTIGNVSRKFPAANRCRIRKPPPQVPSVVSSTSRSQKKRHTPPSRSPSRARSRPRISSLEKPASKIGRKASGTTPLHGRNWKQTKSSSAFLLKKSAASTVLTNYSSSGTRSWMQRQISAPSRTSGSARNASSRTCKFQQATCTAATPS